MTEGSLPERPAYSELPPQLRRSDAATAVVENVRHSEMSSLCDRLGSVGNFAWSSAWVMAATLLGGAVLGAAFGLIPFFSATPKPSHWDRLLYLGAIGIGALLTLVCVAGALTTHKERGDSI